MALRGIQPKTVQKRLKALFYGAAGVGKSTAAASFPAPYFIDTERGVENDQYVRLLQKSGGVIFQTTDFDDLVTEITSLLTEKHEFKTVIIDPITTLYNDLLDKSAIKNGTDFGRHYSEANKKMKHLLNLLLRLDMNVIITCHSKNEYGQNMSVLGQTYDGYKKLDYLFDLVFEIQKRGQARIGIIKKSRIKEFPDGETFPFCYEEISNRYGADVLEKEAIAERLADKVQIMELDRLIALLNVPEEIYRKWLDKANSESFAEMPYTSMQKCIEHLKSKIQDDINGKPKLVKQGEAA